MDYPKYFNPKNSLKLFGLEENFNFLSSIYGLTKYLKRFDKIGDLEQARSSHVALTIPEDIIDRCARATLTAEMNDSCDMHLGTNNISVSNGRDRTTGVGRVTGLCK